MKAENGFDVAPTAVRRARSFAEFSDMFGTTTVDTASSTPLFMQVSLAIREKILSSGLVNGDLLPSEASIIELFGVSRITARRAIKELVGMGLAKSHKGVGTLVSYQGTRHRQRGSIEDLLENLLVIGATTQVRLILFEHVAPSALIASALQVDPEAYVQHAVRLRMEDEVPLSLIDTYLPGDVGRHVSRAELEHIPLQTLLVRAGIHVERAEQTLSACPATGQEARLLGVESGAPLFRIARTVFDARGVPVEHVIALYRSDRYVYHMSLVQSKGQWKRA